MLNLYIPERPATPHTSSHLNDSSVHISRLANPATRLSFCDLRLLQRTELIQPHCSGSVHSLRSSNHHLAAASHTERLDSESSGSRSFTLLAGASSKGYSRSPKRQFASDLGLEEQQNGYAESLHSKTSGLGGC